jgi:quaternary ammonium compound-resistance protein SugE
MAWWYLFFASLMEMGWIYSLKYLDFQKLKKAASFTEAMHAGFPFLGYIAFGLANIYFFSLAMKKIPASTAFAVWTVIALAGIKLIDMWVLREPSKASDYFFLLLAIIAIAGLKKS